MWRAGRKMSVRNRLAFTGSRRRSGGGGAFTSCSSLNIVAVCVEERGSTEERWMIRREKRSGRRSEVVCRFKGC